MKTIKVWKSWELVTGKPTKCVKNLTPKLNGACFYFYTRCVVIQVSEYITVYYTTSVSCWPLRFVYISRLVKNN